MSAWWALPALATVVAAAGTAVALRRLQEEVDALHAQLGRLRSARSHQAALARATRHAQGRSQHVGEVIRHRGRR